MRPLPHWLAAASFPALAISLLLASSTAQAVDDVASRASEIVAERPAAGALSATDEAFIRQAGQASVAELAAARLALKRSQRADIKAFARQMVDDHTAANAKLETLASAKKTPPPHEPDDAQRKALLRLEKLPDTAFDDAYIAALRNGHAVAIALFSKEAAHGQDADLQQLAADALPMLQRHQQRIQALSDAKP
ncbi:hypothetical protein IGB42_02000 [Andreprevotia sp. IGB-42]|uniref:DUF4142 domain-containing protein n=1 Tax=Andreprevotia sp. IGB-42 TaxID=2497473 RepID=UPI001358E1ED|nr:DUF4142 domain-containing protein [Andreprevotia sp. IGB-42]KAF0813649.1 hypothetical protein IGB42_02000 [Andreprevotia sp. IGB-42]